MSLHQGLGYEIRFASETVRNGVMAVYGYAFPSFSFHFYDNGAGGPFSAVAQPWPTGTRSSQRVPRSVVAPLLTWNSALSDRAIMSISFDPVPLSLRW